MEPEIIKVQADITAINAQLDEVDRRFQRAESSAKDYGNTVNKAADKGAGGFKDQGKAVDDVTSKTKKAEKSTKDYGKATEKATKEGSEGFKKTGKEIDNTTKKTGKLDKGVQKLGIAISGAFAVERLISFGIEAVKMADRAAGIERAFQRVGASLIELRTATRGTISDVELMTAAVNAKNLGVPVEELAGLLGFASARARETGQTVDGLVQSIVNGLGRKSTLVLDNLGISAIAIKEALGDTSLEAASVAQLTQALNKVIAEQGGIAETTASGVQTLGAAWDNYMVAVGKSIDASEGVSDFGREIQDIADVTERWGFWSGVLSIAKGDYAKLGAEARRVKGEIEGIAVAQQKVINEFDNVIATLRKDLGFAETGIVQALKEQLEQIEKQIETAPDQERLNELLRERLNIQNQITKVTTLAATGLIGTLREQLTLVTSQIETAGNQERVNELLEKKLKLETEMNAILNQRKNIEAFEADGEKPDELPEVDDWFLDNENERIEYVDKANAIIAESYSHLSESAKRIKREELMAKMADDDAYLRFIRAQQKPMEQAFTDAYHAEIDAQLAAIQKKKENDEAYAEWKKEQDQLQADAYIGAMANMFETFKILAGDNAEAQKAIAIFQALINAYLAIQNTLATVPYPANLIAASSIGVLAFANVAKIASAEPPKFYDGTDYVALNGNRPGKDTIPALLNEGEGVVTTKSNRQWPGVVKALNAGKFEQYITAKHVQPALKALKKEQGKEKAALLTAAIKGTVNANLNDSRIVGELRRSRRVNEEMAYLLSKQSNRKNPYRI